MWRAQLSRHRRKGRCLVAPFMVLSTTVKGRNSEDSTVSDLGIATLTSELPVHKRYTVEHGEGVDIISDMTVAELSSTLSAHGRNTSDEIGTLSDPGIETTSFNSLMHGRNLDEDETVSDLRVVAQKSSKWFNDEC